MPLTNNNKSTWLNRTGLSAMFLAGSLLTACGGGSSGGSGGGNSEGLLDIQFPQSGSQLTEDTTSAFRVYFATEGDTLLIKLNGNNVTPLFKKQGDIATASFRSLKGFMKDGNNVLFANIKPDDDTIRFTANLNTGLPVVTMVQNNLETIPSYGDVVTVRGQVRRSGLSSMSLSGDTKTSFPHDPSYSFHNIILSNENPEDTKADFSLSATYKNPNRTEVAQYAANGRNFDALAGLQINNEALDVISPFMGEVLGAALSGYLAKVRMDTPSSELCNLLPTGLRSENSVCRMSFNDFGKEQENEDGLNPTVDLTLSFNDHSDIVDVDQGFELLVRMGLSDFIVDIDIPVSSGAQSDPEGTVSAKLKLDLGSTLTFYLEGYKDEETREIGIKFTEGQSAMASDITVGSVEQAGCSEESSAFCAAFDEEEVKGSIQGATSAGDGQLNNLLEDLFLEVLEDDKAIKIEEANGEVRSVSIRDYLIETARLVEGTSTSVVHGVYDKMSDDLMNECQEGQGSQMVCTHQTVTPGKVATAKDGGNDANHGAFVSLGGSAYATSTTGTKEDIKTTLGSLMNTKALDFAEDKRLGNEKGLVLGVSENMMNQVLMTTYQSGQLIGLTEDLDPLTISIYKDDYPSGFSLLYNEDWLDIKVSLHAELSSVPYITLNHAENAVVLHAKQLEVAARHITNSYKPDIVAEGAEVLNASLDVEALLELTVVDGKPKLIVKEDQISMNLVGASSSLGSLSIGDQTIKDLFIANLPDVLADLVGSVGDQLIPSIPGFTVDIEGFLPGDAEGVGVKCTKVGESNECRNNERVRENLPKRFVLNLPAGGAVINQDGKAIYFSGDLEENNSGETGLFDITFCSSSAYLSVPDEARCAE